MSNRATRDTVPTWTNTQLSARYIELVEWGIDRVDPDQPYPQWYTDELVILYEEIKARDLLPSLNVALFTYHEKRDQ